LLSTKDCYVGGARGNQIENAAFLLATGNLARLCLSSDLVSFDYKTTAKYVRIPGHRQFIVLRDENLGAV
jgi:hypothetical protein